MRVRDGTRKKNPETKSLLPGKAKSAQSSGSVSTVFIVTQNICKWKHLFCRPCSPLTAAVRAVSIPFVWKIVRFFISFRKRGQETGWQRVYNAGTFDSIWGITVNNARMLYRRRYYEIFHSCTNRREILSYYQRGIPVLRNWREQVKASCRRKTYCQLGNP